MIPGYNHNIRYKNQIFHIQTEDSGVDNPHIITLLYQGGNILARKKTSYADIVRNENVEDVVKELMQDQHKGMLRNLRDGDYDDRLRRFGLVIDEKPTGEPPPPPPDVKEEEVIDIQKDDSIFGSDLISDKSLDEVILS